MITIEQLFKAAPENKGHGASFEDPLALLGSCHDKIIHFSSTLYKMSLMLTQSGWTDELSNTANKISHYFNIAGPEHHLDEEQHLFPAIIALDPQLKNKKNKQVTGLINQMIKEHVESDSLWEKIDLLLTNKSKDFKQLQNLSQQFEKSMHQHAEIENSIIFPFAKAQLSVKEFKKMGAAIAKRRGVKL